MFIETNKSLCWLHNLHIASVVSLLCKKSCTLSYFIVQKLDGGNLDRFDKLQLVQILLVKLVKL